MRKAVCVLTILFAATGLTWAGPEPYSSSGKEMKQVVPVTAPECFSWTGFYVGGFGGYKRSNVDLDLDLSGLWSLGPVGQARGEAAGSGDLDNDGGELGGLIGYNWQHDCWVFGLEADGGYLWARDSKNINVPRTDFDPFHVGSSFKTHYLFTIAPRIGYAFGRWLPYVTGGLAVGDLELAQEVAFPGGAIVRGAFTEGGRETETNCGWMVGGGLQYALTNHWSVRGQYQYIDLGDVSFESNFISNDAPAHHHAELTEHNASVAVMYGF